MKTVLGWGEPSDIQSISHSTGRLGLLSSGRVFVYRFDHSHSRDSYNLRNI